MDLRYALRSLRKDPAFTILAVFVMALGIGANTAVFSVVNAVLLKPLSYHEPDRIVTLSSLWRKSGLHGNVSAPDFHDWHHQSTSFSAMADFNNSESSVSARSGAEYAMVAEVSPEFFDVFDIKPIAGRPFNAEQLKSGTAVQISYSYWQSHFGGSPDAIGESLRMFQKTFTIAGVLSPGFDYPDKAAVWFPANTVFTETTSRSAHNYQVVARLKPGVPLERAQAEMEGIGSRLEQQYPASNSKKGVAVFRMRDEMVGNVKLTLYVLLGAVGMVLLIACANMANLLLAKATARSREIAIRAAVGASRTRIVRQLVTESLLLAVISGVAGLVLALWGSTALVALAPTNIPRLANTGIDSRVLAFTFGVSVLASLLFGLVPAIQASRADLNHSLKQGSRTGTAGAANRFRSGLVVAEIAFSVVLLTGAGLLIKSFVALNNVSLGFRPEHVLVVDTSVPSSNLEGRKHATQLYKALLADVAAMPGVTAAGATMMPPGHVASNGGYWIDHFPAQSELTVNSAQAVFSIISPGALRTLGIPLRRGRDFNGGDTFDAPFTALINESLARKSFPGQDPIGRTIYCGYDSLKPMIIVGVVGDIRQFGPAADPRPEIFMPYEQHPRASLRILARTASDPLSLSEPLRRLVKERAADVPVKFSTMESRLSENIAAPRFRTLLFGIFAALAVLLAMAGVYGVMAYVVGQRSNEIGLRMALGAAPGDVLRLVLWKGLILAGMGLAVGLLGAFAATRLLTSMLFNVRPGDPATYAAVAGLLTLVALAACYLPAHRATKVDPLVALRQE